jgi:hypothetical protein
MRDLLLKIVGNPSALVGISSFLATFIASVMANEQNARLRNGTFGTIAGGAVGGFAAIIGGDKTLVLVGIFGSASGAIIGWLVYLCLSLLATLKWARPLIEYQVSGLKGVSERIDLEDRNLLLKALTVWSQNFRGMVLREVQVILANASCSDYNQWVAVALRGWLTSLVDAFNLVLDALAMKSDYRTRVTLIVFGQRPDGAFVGRHWLAYAGDRQGHRKMDFDNRSIAAQVLAGSQNSPCFKTLQLANKDGQDRGTDLYASFYIFRLNDHAVLSLDWPGKIEENDDYISVARRLLYMDVAPAIGKLLDEWHGPLAKVVELQPAAKAPIASEPAPVKVSREPVSVGPKASPPVDGVGSTGGKGQVREEVLAGVDSRG